MDDNAAAGTPGTVTQKPFAGQETNEFAWSVLDALPTGVVVCEATAAGLQVIYHNPRFSEALHLPDDVVAGANLASLLEDSLDERDLAALRAPTGRVDVDVDVEVAPGSRTTLRLAPHPAVNHYWIGSVEQPAALPEPARGILESMIDASRNLVAAKDLEGRYISVNSAYAEFFAQPKEAFLGLSLEQFRALRNRRPLPAEPSLTPTEQQAVSSGRPAVRRGVRIPDASGRQRVMDVVHTPVMDGNDEIKFIISVGCDSTEIDYWSERYEVQTELLVQLMDAIPEPIWVCDADGNWEQNNLAFKQLIGASDEATRRYDFFHDERIAREMRAADQRVISHNTRELLEDVPVADGEGDVRWFDVLKVPLNVQGEDARRVVSVGHDITRRHRAEAAQREQLRATRLVAKVSSLFVTHPPERIDEQLTAALGEVAGYAGAFRCIVHEMPRPDGAPRRTAEWRADGIMPGVADTAPWELNWLMGELEQRGYVACHSIDQLPSAAAEEATICRREGINAFIAAPLKLNGRNRGILFVNGLRSDPEWTETTAGSICVCANILAAAIDRAATERRLAEASKQLREIATSIPGAIFQWEISERRMRLTYVSEGIVALTELDFADVVRDPEEVLKLVDVDSRRAVLRRALAAAESLEPFQMEVPFNLPRSGSRRWVKLSVSARRAEDGRVLLDGLINDVTDVKQHEQALLAARNQLDSVTRSIPGMVYQARYVAGSLVPALLFASRGTKDIFGIDANTIIGNPELLSRMVLVEDVPSLRASLERAIGELVPWKHEFRIRDATGQLKWIQGTALPTQPDEQGGIQFNGMLMDVTDRTRQRRLPERFEAVRSAIEARDIDALGEVVEAEAIDLHCIAMTSAPAIFYWQPETLTVLAAVRELRASGVPAFATMDAGANVHVICEAAVAPVVADRLEALPEVLQVLRDGVGEGPRTSDEHLL